MDSSGYHSATNPGSGAPSTVISSSEAHTFSSGATGSSWTSYDSHLADAAAAARSTNAIPEEQEEEEEPASPDKPYDASSRSGRPAPGTTRRTRATLVCAECKRLKLQCDRKRPHCSKCVQRQCTLACTYTEASQGKLDLVGLHNRLTAVEEKVERERHENVPSQGWTLPFAHIDREKETQVLDRKSELLVEDTLLAVSRNGGATLAVHHSGSTEIWFKDLNFSSSLVRGNGMHAYRTVLRPHRGQYGNMTYREFLSRHTELLVPGELSVVRRPGSTVASPRDDLMSDDASVASEDDDEEDAPRVERKFVSLLPSSPLVRKILFDELESGQRFHDAPAINVRWVRNRVESMVSQAERMAGGNEGAGNDEPAPTLSFFAAAAAAVAVGAQLYLQKHGSIGAHDAIGAAGGGGGGLKAIAGSASSGSSNATVSPLELRARSKSPLIPMTPPKDEIGISDELHESMIHASNLALRIHEEQSGHAAYDIDYIFALILHAHYLLQFQARARSASVGNNTGKGKGKGKRKAPAASRDNAEDGLTKLPSMHPDLPQVLGKLVISSRQMGLDHEGDSLSNDLFTEFDRETRRRLWWEIVVLDWIVNSNLNKACLIHDNDHTTGLPTVLDESQPYETALSKLPKAKDVSSLDSIAFFINKCTFVKALKSLKDNNPHRDGGGKANLEEDIDEIERKIAIITTWSESVPDKMQGKLLQTVLAEFNKEVSDPPPMSSLQPPQADESDMLVDSLPNVPRLPLHPKPSAKLLESAARLTQITVILLRENHAKVKLYLPWVKAMPVPKHSASVEIGASRAVAAIDPARLVIELSQVLLPPLKYVLMAKFMKYSFGRFIFDSAVVLSHIAIYAPANGLTCIPLLETAMNLLSNAYHVRGFSGNVEQGKDSVRILSELHKKARAASEEHQNRFTVGNKRKRDEEGSSTEAFMGTFHVPFIGAGVKCYGIRRVAGEIAEQEAHGVTHPRVLPEEIQPPVAPSNRAQSPEKAMNSREKSTSLVESNSSSSSSTTKRRKTEGVTIRSRVMDKSKRGDGEHRRSSTTSRRQSAAPLTTRPRADSSLSSPVTSAPQSVVSEPLPQPTFSLHDTLHSASRVPAPIQTNVRPTATSDIQPLTSPSHYMRPPSSLGPSRSTEFSHFDARHAVPSQQPPHPQRPTFGGAQFQQPFPPQSLANSPLSQYNSPQYQPPPLSQAEQYPESSMGMHPQGVEGPSYHIPSPVHVSANPSYAHQNQMLGVHSEQPMQGSSQQQQYYHPSMPPAHPPMLYDQSVHSQNHGEQQQQQQWMNNVNAPPPPGEWPGHSHQ